MPHPVAPDRRHRAAAAAHRPGAARRRRSARPSGYHPPPSRNRPRRPSGSRPSWPTRASSPAGWNIPGPLRSCPTAPGISSPNVPAVCATSRAMARSRHRSPGCRTFSIRRRAGCSMSPSLPISPKSRQLYLSFSKAAGVDARGHGCGPGDPVAGPRAPDRRGRDLRADPRLPRADPFRKPRGSRRRRHRLDHDRRTRRHARPARVGAGCLDHLWRRRARDRRWCACPGKPFSRRYGCSTRARHAGTTQHSGRGPRARLRRALDGGTRARRRG